MELQQYLEFLAPDTLFYKPIEHQRKSKNFKIDTLDSNNWEQNTTSEWFYCINKQNTLPKQGWKIHITSDLKNAQETLDRVTPYLIEKNISFKFVPNLERLLFKNAKNANRASSGKFITIYPLNEKQFLSLLPILESLTEDLERGPYILNDKRWKHSNVYFRYGGFLPMFVDYNGLKVPAIENPEGELIPDLREPYYTIPNFIEEPKMIKNMTEEVDRVLELEDTSAFDKYEILSALHFSNGGGVYKVRKNNQDYVMKEGRSKTGLDRLNLDGFDRIKIESKTLNKLKNKNYVVKYHDYFEIWENNYLVEEYLDGVNLKDFVAQNFPFSHKEDKQFYKKNMMGVINQLYICIEDLHKNDIALGDLQPNNVIVMDNGDIKIIDLESSTSPNAKYNPGLMTPGYVAKKAPNFQQADWFALLRISRFLFLPIENLSELSIDIECNQNLWIEKFFGSDVIELIYKIEEKTAITLDTLKRDLYLTIPKKIISKSNLNNTINNLITSIENNIKANIDSPKLIDGDIKQYIDRLGSWNISNGAFGAIMAIERSKGKLNSNITKWIEEFLVNENISDSSQLKQMPTGLFNGISGIAAILYDIGYKKEGIKFLKNIDFKKKHTDLTLSTGIAGLGLSYISFYSCTKDEYFLQKAFDIYEILKEHFIKDKTIVMSNDSDMPYGLMNGWSGISLFILYVSKFLSSPTEGYNLSIEMLNYEIENNISINEELELAQIEEYSLGHKRVIPYLGEGGAGLALIIIEFLKTNPYFNKEKYKDLLNKTLNISNLYSTYTSGLFRGATGMIVLANAESFIRENNSVIEHAISSLNNYMLYNDEVGLVTPGEFGYRLSMDLQTGTSGILLALNDIGEQKWDSWFPIPKENTLGIFKGGEQI